MSVFPQPGSARHTLLIFSATESLQKGNAALEAGEFALAQAFYGAGRRDLACIGHPIAREAGTAEQFARVLAETEPS